ncbi:MAG: 4-hydroxybutyryl-CoA dehydratase [Chloroflexi bacterium RBG_16_48_8]|nr:MAG: 4-hydroxybutyryl-CoA dehydratase [Chloroflexi bacterium RBG_16_48_8]
MKTSEEYVNSLRNLKRDVYLFGEKLEDPLDHPIIKPSTNAIAMTYELAHDSQFRNLATVPSSLTGIPINRFTHLHQSAAELVEKIKLQRVLGQKTAVCFQRCVGWDAMNALDSVTYELDEAYGTEYHKRFRSFLGTVQEKDLVCDGAMTDVKGDRSLSPSQQADPDLYLHIVDERKDGMVVRGAKVHQTGIVNSHEIIVMPTASIREEDADYAISFAVPTDTPGITVILGRQSCDLRLMEGGVIDPGNIRFGGHEGLVIFEDVFVPWERVFMCREYAFAGMLVERFAAYHRQSYGGCKVGLGDVAIGAAALIAEYNGTDRASHIRDKIVEMVHLNETLYSCGLACSSEGKATGTGTYLVDIILANVTKHNTTRFPYEILRLLEDIAGGLLVTLPSEKDFRHPEIGPKIDKYLKGKAGVPTENRFRLLRLIENMTFGRAAIGYRAESMHGAGSPQAQRIMIARTVDFEAKKELAKNLAGIAL